MSDENAGDVLKPLQEHLPDAKVTPATGIAAIALTMAMKYHDINTVQDGALYQQYKLEGKNMTPLHLDMVFETAIRIEMHLLASFDRIAQIVVDALDAPEQEASTTSKDPAHSRGTPHDL